MYHGHLHDRVGLVPAPLRPHTTHHDGHDPHGVAQGERQHEAHERFSFRGSLIPSGLLPGRTDPPATRRRNLRRNPRRGWKDAQAPTSSPARCGARLQPVRCLAATNRSSAAWMSPRSGPFIMGRAALRSVGAGSRKKEARRLMVWHQYHPSAGCHRAHQGDREHRADRRRSKRHEPHRKRSHEGEPKVTPSRAAPTPPATIHTSATPARRASRLTSSRKLANVSRAAAATRDISTKTPGASDGARSSGAPGAALPGDRVAPGTGPASTDDVAAIVRQRGWLA